jgi:hypothetical protein
VAEVAKGAPLPAIFTDGELDTVVQASHPGPPPELIMRIPHQLASVKGVKYRREGQRVEVEIGPILGKRKRNDVVPKLGWKRP